MASFPYPPVSLSLQHYADAVEFQVSLASIGVGSLWRKQSYRGHSGSEVFDRALGWVD
jgi:hypothetical protein